MARRLAATSLLLLMLLPFGCASARKSAVESGFSLAGRWGRGSAESSKSLVFRHDGKFELESGSGKKDLYGNYTAKNGVITFLAMGGRYPCMKTGAYKFDIRSGTLLLSVIKDSCRERKIDLGGEWKRK